MGINKQLLGNQAAKATLEQSTSIDVNGFAPAGSSVALRFSILGSVLCGGVEFLNAMENDNYYDQIAGGSNAINGMIVGIGAGAAWGVGVGVLVSGGTAIIVFGASIAADWYIRQAAANATPSLAKKMCGQVGKAISNNMARLKKLNGMYNNMNYAC